jgi:hypothetical protein
MKVPMPLPRGVLSPGAKAYAHHEGYGLYH